MASGRRLSAWPWMCCGLLGPKKVSAWGIDYSVEVCALELSLGMMSFHWRYGQRWRFSFFGCVGFGFEFTEKLVGGAAIDELGTPLPEDTLSTCQQSDAVLLAAIGGYVVWFVRGCISFALHQLNMPILLSPVWELDSRYCGQARVCDILALKFHSFPRFWLVSKTLVSKGIVDLRLLYLQHFSQ